MSVFSTNPKTTEQEKQYLVWVTGTTGLSGRLGGKVPGLFTKFALGGRGFFGGIAGTEGFCKSNCFCSLSDLSLNQLCPEKY